MHEESAGQAALRLLVFVLIEQYCLGQWDMVGNRKQWTLLLAVWLSALISLPEESI